MSLQETRHRSIFMRLADGSLQITSKREFQDLMAMFPDKGEVLRAQGDFLMQGGQTDEACQAYTLAAKLFAAEGKTFQAIVAKILAWRTVKPTHAEGRTFYSALQSGIKEESPLQLLFTDIAYPEFIALVLKLVRVRLEAGQTILRAGQNCEHVFFVVSGILEESIPRNVGTGATHAPADAQHIYDNDIFGDIFPLHEKTRSRSQVKALTPVEVVKISKVVLSKTCRKYPRLERLLTKLYKGPPEGESGRSWSSVRRSSRHDTPVRTTVMLYLRRDDASPVAFEGMSRDISLGGACIDLGLKYGSMRPETLSGIRSVVEIAHPSGETISIPGHVAWSKIVKEPGGTSILAGIKFEPLPDRERDFLKVHCFGYENEQRLMWGLWEGYFS